MKPTKQELLARIEALEAINTKRSEVTSMLSASEPKEEEIVVPDSIVFEKMSGDGDELGIVFNEGKQNLCHSEGVYRVSHSSKHYHLKGSNFKLIKIDPNDREVGHTYYFYSFLFGDNAVHNTDSASNYCKYLGNDRFVRVERETNVMVGSDGLGSSDDESFDWYKVVRR